VLSPAIGLGVTKIPADPGNRHQQARSACAAAPSRGQPRHWTLFYNRIEDTLIRKESTNSVMRARQCRATHGSRSGSGAANRLLAWSRLTAQCFCRSREHELHQCEDSATAHSRANDMFPEVPRYNGSLTRPGAPPPLASEHHLQATLALLYRYPKIPGPIHRPTRRRTIAGACPSHTLLLGNAPATTAAGTRLDHQPSGSRAAKPDDKLYIRRYSEASVPGRAALDSGGVNLHFYGSSESACQDPPRWLADKHAMV